MTITTTLPDRRNFAARLFARTAEEDRAQYQEASLVMLAGRALDHLAEPRKGEEPGVRIYDPAGEGDEALAGVTVVEIINTNAPFLLDSTLAELVEDGIEVRLVAHPILHVERDAAGRLVALHEQDGSAGPQRESLIHIHVPRLGEARKQALREGLLAVYADVRMAVADWRAMRQRVLDMAERYKSDPPPLPVDEIAEARQFLIWLAADNFTFLGLREYSFAEPPNPDANAVEASAGDGLGLLRDSGTKVLRRGGEDMVITPEILSFLHQPQALIITKANVRSRVHRRVHMDYVGIKQFDADGQLCGEIRLVGLFTSTAYTRSTQTIPYVRRKIARVLEIAQLDPASHSGKVLVNVLEEYPRDDLFQIDVETLAEFAQTIVQLYEHPRVRALARPDRFDRFVSVLVYVPRDRYDSKVRAHIGEYLAGAFDGRVSAAYPYYPEGPLVRTQFIIGRDGTATPEFDRRQIERDIAAIVRTWGDALASALSRGVGHRGELLAVRYASAFEPGYMNVFTPDEAIADIAIAERLSSEHPRTCRFYQMPGDGPAQARMKVFSRHSAMPLSERVPMMEHMGFRVISEDSYRIEAAGSEAVWLHDMLLERASGAPLGIAPLKPALEAMAGALFRGLAESDGYNALCVEAGLGWRDIAMLRGLSRYMQQTELGYSQDYMWQTLVRHASIAARLVEFFHTRFDPRSSADHATQELAAAIEQQLSEVDSLDDDRILRAFLLLARNALRTNFFQTGADGHPATVISFKFESSKLPFLPLPRPLYEIFVYSPRVEGVHLRFGKVARGGLRWSDRPQDFRTEILGLVKAQQVKNAVIVPVGAKGGFVPRHLPPPSDREAFMAEGIACYKLFIGALLDITDNLVEGRVVSPQNVVRHDGNDPYLVVAADKGTATFSDIANAISLEHHHWLGDAFASGGSAGYDHKAMGITARGAWEAVKRHFREMDIDIQTQPFTCVGVGDMSGDVFGNGMLLSPATKLIAAFDHRDIFIDPNPDPAISMRERARLFALPRSSWQDYDKGLISEGGGVYSRRAKSITLSAQAQAALGIEDEELTPQALMSVILRAPADLLWFGGIGTYVKSSAESHADASDRANDTIRINGAHLRCKVIGEGANLGMTQRGRIEAAQHGIRLNTDAIDNSAGVNTSDVEVNIKIALSEPVRQGRITETERNALLASMTGDVARLVLRNNYEQSLALSIAQRGGAGDAGLMRALMQKLEGEGRLNRTVEHLPGDAALSARARDAQGLTRPELAILLAYAKLSLYDHLLESDLPDDPWLTRELDAYFPSALNTRLPDEIGRHPLRREIISTALSNATVNRGGPAIASRLADQTGADAAQVVRAFVTVREIFALDQLYAAVDALDTKIAGALQLDLYASIRRLLLARMSWFARHESFASGLSPVIEHYRQGMDELANAIADVSPQEARERMAAKAAELREGGVDASLAQRIVALDALGAGPEIILTAKDCGAPIARVAAVYFAAEHALGIEAITRASRSITASDIFERRALERALSEVSATRRIIVGQILASSSMQGSAPVADWLAAKGEPAARRLRQIAEINTGGLSLARLSVAAGLLQELAG